MTPRVRPIEERFLEKVAVDENGCWIWTASGTGKGYGGFWDGKVIRAHRWAYQHWIGPVPDGLQLDHLCRVRLCCNPWHLEPVTQSENNRRGALPAVTIARQRAKTHCPHGHPYSIANTYVSVDGRRSCCTCQRESAQRRRAERLVHAGGES